jgi:xylulokinase
VALPELLWPTEIAGEVTAAAASRTGLPAGLPVTAGTVDAWAEAASVGVREPGDVMVMYGTTMFLVQVLTEPRPHPGLWGTRGVAPGSFTLAAGMATSGAVTDWLRKLVGASFEDLVAEAASVPAGSRGLLLLPYFAGERTPLFDPAARGVLAGLTTSHGRAEIYRAALEGIAYGVRHNLEAMAAAGGAAGRLVAHRLGRDRAAAADPGGDDRRVPRRRADRGGGGGDGRRTREPDRRDGDPGPGEP